MYRIVKASSLLDIPRDHIIFVDISYKENDSTQYDDIQIAASSKFDPPTELQKEEFWSFVESVLGAVEQRNFVIEDKHKSNRQDSLSYYITFYPTDENDEILDKFCIFLRLSNHSIQHLNQKSRRYHQSQAKKFKRSDSKYQNFMSVNVSIDGKVWSNYGDALDYLCNKFDNMEEGIYN